MSKKLLLIEMAVAVTIVILEALIEEADKLSSEQNNSLSPIVSPFAEKRSLRFGPIALAVLCLFFSLVTILLWFARFFEPVTGSKLFVHSMNVLHFFYCVAMVASSSLEVLKFYGLNLKHFSYAPLILACAVVILVTIELLYFLFTASRAEATTNASRTVGAANASSNMGAANGFPRTADAVELSFGPTPSQLRSARAVTYSEVATRAMSIFKMMKSTGIPQNDISVFNHGYILHSTMTIITRTYSSLSGSSSGAFIRANATATFSLWCAKLCSFSSIYVSCREAPVSGT